MALSKFSSKFVGVCFICKTERAEEDKRISTFSVTKTNLATWKEILPGIQIQDKLCDKHFEPGDVVKEVWVLNYISNHTKIGDLNLLLLPSFC